MQTNAFAAQELHGQCFFFFIPNFSPFGCFFLLITFPLGPSVYFIIRNRFFNFVSVRASLNKYDVRHERFLRQSVVYSMAMPCFSRPGAHTISMGAIPKMLFSCSGNVKVKNTLTRNNHTRSTGKRYPCSTEHKLNGRETRGRPSTFRKRQPKRDRDTRQEHPQTWHSIL